ncbi:D-hexose-6-phosphate mutarotase [Glaciimonas sp. GG7]
MPSLLMAVLGLTFMDMDLITLTSADGAQVSLSLHGAHVCSWRTPDGIERLFLSPLSQLDGSAAIRGGIPVVFPQFANRGMLPKHGIARTAQWTLVASEVRENGDGFMHLTMHDSAQTLLQFPYRFTLDLQVTFSGIVLTTTLSVTNTDTQSFDFACALHTYFAAQIAQVSIRGLSTSRYENSLNNGDLRFDDNSLLGIHAEVDSLFFGVEGAVELMTDDSVVTVQQTGFSDVVVWNPWAHGSAAIADLEDDAYQHYVCIESAVIEHPITLAAGAQWRGQQQLSAVSKK